MKRAVIFGGILSLCMMSAPAVYAGTPGSYASAQLSISSYSGMSSSGMALTGTYGMPLTALIGGNSGIPYNMRNNLFFEAEGSITVSDAKDSYSILGTNYNLKGSYYSLGGYAVYRKPLGTKLSVDGRLGLVYEHDTASTSGAINVSASSSSFGLSFGAGLLYHLSSSMDLRADYTIVSSDITNLSVGVQIPLQ